VLKYTYAAHLPAEELIDCRDTYNGILTPGRQNHREGTTAAVALSWVVAHKSTLNILERTRPKGLMKGYAGGSGLFWLVMSLRREGNSAIYIRGFGEAYREYTIDQFGPDYMNVYKSYFTQDCNDESSLPEHNYDHIQDFSLTVDEQIYGEALFATMEGLTNCIIVIPSTPPRTL
jgi:hypothetical protein